MKRFIIRNLIFFGLLLAVLGSICAVELYYEVTAYSKEVVAPESAEILVCNDSQLEMGVNPDVDAAFFNFSAAGRMMDQAYLAMLDVLKANPGRFKTVLIDISPITAIDTFDQPISQMGFAGQYYLLHWLHPQENMRKMDGQLAVFRDNMVGRRLRLLSRALRGKVEFKSSIRGGFKAVDETLAVGRQAGFTNELAARAKAVSEAAPLSPQAPIFRIAKAMIAQVRAYGAEPIVMTSPWHEALLAACARDRLETFTRVVSAFAASHGCRYVDLLRRQLPDECWYDSHHLNVKGARLFTPLLHQALEED